MELETHPRVGLASLQQPGQPAAPDASQHGPREVLIERLDDVVAITLVPGTQITHVDTLKIRGQLIDVFNGQASGLMLQLAGVATIDREAMTLYAKAVAVSALAVVGSSPVDRVVAHRLVGMTSPRCPHRYFTCRDEALEWLRSKPAS